MKSGARRRINVSCLACPGRISKAPVSKDAKVDLQALPCRFTGSFMSPSELKRELNHCTDVTPPQASLPRASQA